MPRVRHKRRPAVKRHYQVIVVGGGHAGTEAALAAARMGAETLLLTQSIDNLGQMSCNPAIGGIGKGHLVREIDALGGWMARGADRCGIQFRTLNASKGPAVRATRAQVDRARYRQATRSVLERQPGLALLQQEVSDLVVTGGRVGGVMTRMGITVTAETVVLCTGTFLGGRIHIGARDYAGGRAGDPACLPLAARLRELSLGVGRLKTGTPPRLDARSVNYAAMQPQPGDVPVPVFSFIGSATEHPRQVPCHCTHTNPASHDVVRAALAHSPVHNGAIGSPGPRYCMSIEDKVTRFAERDAHKVFIEPEGLESNEVYPNGISTSLPFEAQLALVRSINGLEQAHLTRPGYAIEYDYLDPRGLRPWLESGTLANLFLAGQINGTTGYEEAAAQGLLAGINAARRAQQREPWYPGRDRAYLGVLVDDLVTRGAPEPYRMFTSRAEHRLLLREGNADLRLTPVGRELGLVDDRRWRRFLLKQAVLEREQRLLEQTRVQAAELPAGSDVPPGSSLAALLRRPDLDYARVMALAGRAASRHAGVAEELEARARYDGYIRRQQRELERNRRHRDTPLPADLDYNAVTGLSTEAVVQLSTRRPATLGQAERIPGVTPAAVSLLCVHLRRHRA